MHGRRQGRLFGLELDDNRLPIFYRRQIRHVALAEFVQWSFVSLDIIKTPISGEGSRGAQKILKNLGDLTIRVPFQAGGERPSRRVGGTNHRADRANENVPSGRSR